MDFYVQVPFSFIVCGANNLRVHLIKTSPPLVHHSSPSFHFPGFTALERQTEDRCTCSLNRLKEVLTSSLLSSRVWLPLAAPQKFQKSRTSTIIYSQFILFFPLLYEVISVAPAIHPLLLPLLRRQLYWKKHFFFLQKESGAGSETFSFDTERTKYS